MIIIKKAKPRNSTLERPENTLYENEEVQSLAQAHGILVVQNFSGWMDEYLMANFYIPHLKKHLSGHPYPLLLFDNFWAHSTDKVIEKFQEQKIEYMHLPPNCTPIIQPLDVGVNSSLKKKK